ncbi:MAG TPA: hypothetical protein VF521_01975 [Pyrinomonadaceae bacterium]
MKRHAAIELHVGELVLEGFAPAERHAVADAFERELTRLLNTHGLPNSRPGEAARLDAGSVRVAPGLGAKAAGAQIARAVYGGLKR